MSDCPHKTLLPHPTQFERDLEAHAAEKYCRLDADLIRRLHDPWQCPLEFLPWLAYAMSVDVWNEKWPEATKRAVVANSLEMHRNKGTHGGVLDALALFGVTPEIVYWHEMQPEGEPGTMQLTIWINDNLLPESGMMFGPEMLRDVQAQLERSKRASIHYTFRLGVEAEKSGFGTAFSAQLTTRQKVEASNNRIRAASQPVGAGVGFSAQLTTRQAVTASSTSTRASSQPSGHGLGWSAQLTTRQAVSAVADRVQAMAQPAGIRMGFSAQIYTRQCVRAMTNGNAPHAAGWLHMPLRMASSIQMTTLLRLEATT